MSEPFTEAQEDAIKKMEILIREHFAAGFFIVMSDIDGMAGSESATTSAFHGGKMTCLGLAEFMKSRLLQPEHESGVGA